MSETHVHQSVLLHEAVAALRISSSGCYLDGTFGRGGHSRVILQALGQEGRLLAIDKDPAAVESGCRQFADDSRFVIEHGSFAMLERLAGQRGLMGKVDGILLDLGVSSPQLDNPERGFSFMQDGPLDMRMDTTSGMSAADWLNQATNAEIAQVLKSYGEERFAKRIARAIVVAREEAPIMHTGQLAAVIAQANPVKEPGRNPATRSFQAIRIYINRELDDLRDCLRQVLDILAPSGRLVIISFHSLEDRIVKRFMRDHARGDDFPIGVPVTHKQLSPRLRLVGKATRPSAAEVHANPRARSAVLRVAECPA
ncbi:16S rRNA (cytosine(1402)-N(4))-methyltransferase [hydrothermal vent metagenome]|uniref:16S rRNA (Cytosine(1402)-N(4))-methyltransferase n=1 Tax=hydrothermal vent metagenome TaxID=652676 RepID=A0A3B1B9Y5_9ZZZZ